VSRGRCADTRPRGRARVSDPRGEPARRWGVAGSLCLLCALLATSPAAAHPHIWIDTGATFVFERGKVISLRLDWTFDEVFSDTLLHAVPGTRRPGKLDERQIKHLYDHDFANLKTDQYFIHLYVGDKRLPIREVADFTAASRDGRVVYQFTVRLPSPVDPVSTPLTLSVYDESYFVEVAFTEATPVRFVGSPDPSCRYDVAEDRQHPIYFGMVFPQQVRLVCGRR